MYLTLFSKMLCEGNQEGKRKELLGWMQYFQKTNENGEIVACVKNCKPSRAAIPHIFLQISSIKHLFLTTHRVIQVQVFFSYFSHKQGECWRQQARGRTWLPFKAKNKERQSCGEGGLPGGQPKTQIYLICGYYEPCRFFSDTFKNSSGRFQTHRLRDEKVGKRYLDMKYPFPHKFLHIWFWD